MLTAMPNAVRGCERGPIRHRSPAARGSAPGVVQEMLIHRKGKNEQGERQREADQALAEPNRLGLNGSVVFGIVGREKNHQQLKHGERHPDRAVLVIVAESGQAGNHQCKQTKGNADKNCQSVAGPAVTQAQAGNNDEVWNSNLPLAYSGIVTRWQLRDDKKNGADREE